MRWFNFLLISMLGLSSCGWFYHDSTDSNSIPEFQRQALQTKYDTYGRFSSYQEDSDGFIETDACDSLLFSSLLGTVKPWVKVESARDANGEWHRRPLSYPECYTPGDGSTISRDMFVGLFWYIWANKRLDLAQQIYSYGEANNWVMGDGDPSRTYLVPGLQATLAEMIYRLGGENHVVARSIPQVYTSSNVGFTAHLDVLHILLRGEMLGEVNSIELGVLKAQADREPRNALFTYAYHHFSDGDQSQAVASLLNEQLFPANRLPESEDRCEQWIWQRDDGSDWQPCSEGQTHSGGDYLFVTKMLLNL